MKKILFYVALIIAIFTGCKEKPTDTEPLANFTIPVFDSLKGDWSWTSTYHAKYGLIKNEYKYVIKFISLNMDTTINCETYKDDKLVAKNKVKISPAYWDRKIEPKIILAESLDNFTYDNFRFKSKDTLEIFKECVDCSIFYYSRLK